MAVTPFDPPYPKTHAARKLRDSIFHRTGLELSPTEILHYREREFRAFFAPVTLTLTRWRSYTNLICIPWRFVRRPKMKISTSRISNVVVLHRDRQTVRQSDIHTDDTETVTTPLHGW